MILAFWGFAGRKSRAMLKEMNVDIKTTLNIHIFLMECTRKLKFGMMIYHYLVHSFRYSMMPYDLGRNFQGHWYRVKSISC